MKNIRCNMCEWTGTEQNLKECFEVSLSNCSLLDYGPVTIQTLKQYSESTNIEYLKGCPNCNTDKYLTDL